MHTVPDFAGFESIRRRYEIGVLFCRLAPPRRRACVQRPTGVVVIAVLYWLSAFCLILLGAGMVIGFGVFAEMMARMQPWMAGLGAIAGIVMLGFGAAMCAIGYGLFQLQEWARVTTIVLVAISFAGAIFGILHPIGMGRISSVIRMAIDGFIIWYLVQPQVVGCFRRA
jgi:hypothetical protein